MNQNLELYLLIGCVYTIVYKHQTEQRNETLPLGEIVGTCLIWPFCAALTVMIHVREAIKTVKERKKK